ncbi:MAG: hypothetical protein QNJ46_12880 [Leptolyngbyaceae cyanobacterium MO_188.B28]|nr:hypothetical protein [Leptolyngbyaceae cyanobacterium MO_188.B28]
MPQLELTIEQVIELVTQLSIEDKQAVLSALTTELRQPITDPDFETGAWLDADLGEELPPYDWGTEGIPKGQAVHYLPEVGLVIDEEPTLAENT